MVSCFEWISTFCPLVSHVLKTDDDMFINTDLLLEKLALHSTDTFTFYGANMAGSPVYHSPEKEGKWAIDVEIYNRSFYPPYVSGGAYVFTGDVAQEVYYNALETSYFQFEDAFIAGFVRQVVNATVIIIENMFLFARDPDTDIICKYLEYVAVHSLSSSQLIDLYKHDIIKEKLCRPK